jgi:heme/copper-type cytochrome/quinol oxidase subunit 2
MVSKMHAIEILSILITSVVLAYIGVVAGVALIAVDTPPTTNDALHVKVIARQFYWTFQYGPNSTITYPNGTTKFYANGTTLQNTLYVKAGQVVDLELVSTDVAHSFFIYELGVHIDAIPGHGNHYWLRADSPGQYKIECTQFCGTGHYTMIGQLVVTA